MRNREVCGAQPVKKERGRVKSVCDRQRRSLAFPVAADRQESPVVLRSHSAGPGCFIRIMAAPRFCSPAQHTKGDQPDLRTSAFRGGRRFQTRALPAVSRALRCICRDAELQKSLRCRCSRPSRSTFTRNGRQNITMPTCRAVARTPDVHSCGSTRTP